VKNRTIHFIYLIIAILLFLTSCSSPFQGTIDSDKSLNPINSKKDESDKKELPFYTPIIPPNFIQATRGLEDKIEISWNHTAEALYYNIYRASSIEDSYTKIVAEYPANYDSSTKRITFIDEGSELTLLSSFKYYYKITSVNRDHIVSTFSEITEGFCYLSSSNIYPPLEISASNGDFLDKILIIWNTVPNANSYIISRSESADGQFEPIGESTTSIFEDKYRSLIQDKKYYYTIESKVATTGEMSVKSMPVLGYLASDEISSTIENLRATQSIDQDSITISWDKVPGIVKYVIYKSDSQYGIYSEISPIIVPQNGTPQYIDTNGIRDEKNHFYKIKCFIAEKSGALSNTTAIGWVTKAPPEITLLGDNPLIIDLTKSQEFIDPQTRTIDNVDGDLSYAVTSIITNLAGEEVFPEERGEYKITYHISDRVGQVSEKIRIVKIVANLNSELAELTRSIRYPEKNDSITFTLNGITADKNGGDVFYTWKFNDNPAENSTTINHFTTNLMVSTYELNITVFNEDDIYTTTMDFSVYPTCFEIPNGDFESGETVAPWLWDVDYFKQFMSLFGPTFPTWVRDKNSNTSNNLIDSEENISNLLHNCGKEESNAAVFSDTTLDTGASLDYDIRETVGSLSLANIDVVNNVEYKLSASIYRGIACSTDIRLSVISQNEVDIDPITAGVQTKISLEASEDIGWQNYSIIFKPNTDGKIKIEFFKGSDWETTDLGEVRLDNVSLSYNNE